MKDKIKKPAGLRKILLSLRKKGKRIVFTNGCFDILHYGHVTYLEKSRNLGDILVVAVNSDASVRRIKGKGRPIVAEKDRASIVASLESVNYVVVFDEDSPLNVIKALKPDIIVKGADWKKEDIVGADFVVKNGGRVSTIRLEDGRSTTNLIEKIVKIFRKA